MNFVCYRCPKIQRDNALDDASLVRKLSDLTILLELSCLFIYQARALKVSGGQANGTGPVPAPPAGKQKLPPMDAKTAQQTDEILNSILPPRYIILYILDKMITNINPYHNAEIFLYKL